VQKVTFPDQTIQVTNTGTTSAVQNGDTIQIGNERMFVTGVTTVSAVSPGIWNLTVTRAILSTIEVAHAAGTIVYEVTDDATAAAPVLYTISDSGPKLLPDIGSAGGTFTYYGGLCIGVPTGTTCTNATCKTADGYVASPSSYTVTGAPAQHLSGAINSSSDPLTITTDGTDIENGDYIKIDSEAMLVTAGGGTSSLTVARAQLGTVLDSTHSNGVEIRYIVGTPDVTMADGTYIMAGGGFRVCGAAKVTAPHVLIVNTKDRDPLTGTLYEGLDQIQLNTIGYITLGPPDTGQYLGLSMYQPVTDEMSPFSTASYSPVQKLAAAPGGNIDDTVTTFQTQLSGAINVGDLIAIGTEVMQVTAVSGINVTVDRGNTLTPGSDSSAPHTGGTEIKRVTGSKCDGRSAALTDILLSQIGPVGSTDGLNGITGSIYAPHPYALFADSVSGTADIAVMSGCLFINGADSTFSFTPSLHFGTSTVTFLGEWG